MSFRDTLATKIAPLPVRLVLAITFVWAGLGKITQNIQVTGDQAALLANMGVSLRPPTPPGEATPAAPLPTPTPTPAPAEADPDPDPAGEPADQRPDPAPSESPSRPGGSPPTLMALQTSPAAPAFTAADFPGLVETKRLHGLALLIHRSANPAPGDNGVAPPASWPPALAQGNRPVIQAWAVAITEILGGLFLFTGLFTRLSALSLTGVMLGALWLTGFGPAWQSGNTQFGFLPTHATFDVAAWKDMLWQLALAAASFQLFLSGPGALALDGALFRGRANASGGSVGGAAG